MTIFEKPTLDSVDLIADLLQQRSFSEPERDELLETAAKYLRYLIRKNLSLETKNDDHSTY